jgi:hypothetical protein
MLLTETQILPPVSTFIQAMRQGGLSIESHENYQKKSLRNRFYLSSPKGRITLSVPLKKGKSNQTKITDVGISYDTDWIKDIHHTLTALLRRSAFFDHYIDSLMDVFNQQFSYLWELNNELLSWSMRSGGIDLKVSYTSTYDRVSKPTILDHRNKSLSFYKNPTSNNYIRYDQIFMLEHGFICNLSILDLIMQRGPETGILLKRQSMSSSK